KQRISFSRFSQDMWTRVFYKSQSLLNSEFLSLLGYILYPAHGRCVSISSKQRISFSLRASKVIAIAMLLSQSLLNSESLSLFRPANSLQTWYLNAAFP